MNETLTEPELQTQKKWEPDEGMESVDGGIFYVWKARWGTWCSCGSDGERLITSLDKEQTIRATRFYLKGRQDGWEDNNKSYDGTVGGKL